MASDHGGDHKKRDDSSEENEPNSCIKQNPGGYRRYGEHDRRIERNAEQAQPPQAERQDDGKKDDRNTKYVGYAIALIAMIAGIAVSCCLKKSFMLREPNDRLRLRSLARQQQ
jgi:hypothetical protein